MDLVAFSAFSPPTTCFVLDGYTGKRRWIAQVRQGEVLIAGHFDSDAERRIATALMRMIPGVREVRIGAAMPSTD